MVSGVTEITEGSRRVVETDRPGVGLRLAGWAAIIIVWETLAHVVVRDPLLLPSTWQIVLALVTEMNQPAFYRHIGYTVGQSLVSTSVALAMGIPLGMLLARNRWVRTALEAPLDWLRSIPATALFPVMMLFLGIGPQTRMALAIWAALFIVVVSIMHAAGTLDGDRLAHWRRAGLSRWLLFRHVELAELTPAILGTTRVALSMSLVVIIVGEMFLGAREGIGYLLVYHQARYATATTYALIAMSGIVGWALNAAFRARRL